MTSSSVALVTSSLIVLVLAGCSSGTSTETSGASSPPATASASSADPASFCEKLCTKQSSCDSRVDAQTCASKCENKTASTISKLRSDVITSAETCFESSDCRQVLGGDRLGECIDEAAVSLAPAQSTKDFCDGLVNAATHCDVTLERAKCLSGMKTYSDETLADAKRCLEKSCSQLSDCIGAVFDLSK